jgi:hypothetical protein
LFKLVTVEEVTAVLMFIPFIRDVVPPPDTFTFEPTPPKKFTAPEELLLTSKFPPVMFPPKSSTPPYPTELV